MDFKDLQIKHVILFFTLFVFLAGIYFCINIVEGMENASTSSTSGSSGTGSLDKRCPNLLIQKGPKYYLYNSNLAQVPGVNPIEFNSLEEYSEFLEWQRAAGIRCPVLYVQNTYDAQGQRVYKLRPSVTEPQGGLPPSGSTTLPHGTQLLTDAGRNDMPYNKNSYPAYDQTNQNIGTNTPLDAIENTQVTTDGVSPNPMDPNWGGANFTQSLVDQGYYAGNEVQIAIP